jgi:hypothetical protein
VRLWDKVARLLNLQGWDYDLDFEFRPLPWHVGAILQSLLTVMRWQGYILRLSNFRQVASGRTPQHETIEDTFVDGAVYFIIGLLNLRGQWGR